jgi:hypothetical protein
LGFRVSGAWHENEEEELGFRVLGIERFRVLGFRVSGAWHENEEEEERGHEFESCFFPSVSSPCSGLHCWLFRVSRAS